jgi:hypothetical protein
MVSIVYFLFIVYSRGAYILVSPSTIIVIVRVPSVFYRIIVVLIA